jgi:carboxypeptidase Taq
MMPTGGGASRSEAMATLGSLIHQRLADPEIGELLNRVRAEQTTLDDWQSANLTSMEQAHVQAIAVPAELERAVQLATLRCEQAWREARAANDWDAIRPLLCVKRSWACWDSTSRAAGSM